MPAGFLITVGLVVVAPVVSVRPLGRSGPLGLVTWFRSAIANESPFLGFYYLALSTWLASPQRRFHGSGVWVAVGVAGAAWLLATPLLVRRSLRAAPAIEWALDHALGVGWRDEPDGRSIPGKPPGFGSCSRRCRCFIPASGVSGTAAMARLGAATAWTCTGAGVVGPAAARC